MNHDYAHCSDFENDCPKGCFRAQLVRDMRRNPQKRYYTYQSFKGTGECLLEADKPTTNKRGRR